MPGQRVPLQFGPGLDRDSGYGIQSPGMRDIRNVYLQNGRVELRKGHTAKSTLAGMDLIIGGTGLRAIQIGVLAAYVDLTGVVRLWRVDGLGLGAEDLGEWFTLEAGSIDPPRAIAAESDLRAFFAHDEPRVSKRAPTVYHGPNESGYIIELELNEGTEAEPNLIPMRFRGVASHLEYLVGWGYGTSEEDRPEMVRISLPADAAIFDPNHYLVVGARGDAVLSCVPIGTGVGSSLLVFKGSETHHIFGSHRANFGVQLIDARMGIAGGRLAVNVGGAVFVWSEEGPRVFEGVGASHDLALPLDLRAPSPADLVAAGETESGFAIYIPGRRCVEFRFGARVYKLHLGTKPPQWTYEEVGFAAHAGFQIFKGETTQAPPTGTVSFTSADVLSYRRADLTVALAGHDGDEQVEVWLRPDTGDMAWYLAGVADAAEGASQVIGFTDLDALTTYDVALRLRRSIYFTAGYTDADPAIWPSYVADAFVTPDAVPVIDQDVTFDRVDDLSWRFLLTVTPAEEEEPVELQYRLNGVGAWVSLGILSAVGEPETIVSNSLLGLPGGAQDGTDFIEFQARHPDHDWSASTSVWQGLPIQDTLVTSQQGADGIDVNWDEEGYPGTSVVDAVVQIIGNVFPNLADSSAPYGDPISIREPAHPNDGFFAYALDPADIDHSPFASGDIMKTWIRFEKLKAGLTVTDTSRYVKHEFVVP